MIKYLKFLLKRTWGAIRKQIAEKQYHVCVYLHDQAYGGSEEGGWWFDTYQLSRDHARLNRSFWLETSARRYAQRLETVLADLNAGRRGVTSVLSEGVYDFLLIEKEVPAEFYPHQRPHYE